MKLTYIFHSGFLLETERCVLVFDYWIDPARVMENYMGTSKRVYVFSSHFHEDHFTKEILKWKDSIADVTYILSKDILKRKRADQEDATVWMAKGAVWEDENLKVIATGSNDSGVSWIVELDDSINGSAERKRIFHAGDLCNWYARFLADGARDDLARRGKGERQGEIYSEEFQAYINPVAEEKRFLGELKDVARLMKEHSALQLDSSSLPLSSGLSSRTTQRVQRQLLPLSTSTKGKERGNTEDCCHFDLVMFPVDGRIGNGYTLGGRQFIERFDVGMFVPMHFVASGFESAWRMEPFCREKGIPFWCIKHEGECLLTP